MAKARDRASEAAPARVGRRLRALRQAAGLTQQEVANVLGISFQQLQKYEQGKNELSAARLHRLAVYFGVEVGAFFGGEGVPAAPASPPGAGATRRLAAAFDAIPDAATRRAILALAQRLAD